MTVTSSSFPANGPIPVDMTCDGANTSPSLTFSAPPEKTRSLAVAMVDVDGSSGDVTHWIAYNLSPDATALPASMDPVSFGGLSGTNDANGTGYTGPCPPKMELHRYAFRVFALDAKLSPEAGASRASLDAAMTHHVLAEGVLLGTFSH